MKPIDVAGSGKSQNGILPNLFRFGYPVARTMITGLRATATFPIPRDLAYELKEDLSHA